MVDLAKKAPPDRAALTDRVYEHLKAQIIELELAPGVRLKAEALARELDVSPTPVREALNRLAAERIVTGASYRGFNVSPLLSQEELAQLLQARRVIEHAAIEVTASLCDTGVGGELTALVSEMDALSRSAELDVTAFNAADAEFHRLLTGASGNRFLLDALDALHVHVQIARHYQGRSVAEARQANAEHQRMLRALVDGDGQRAAREADAHIDGVLARLRPHLSLHAGTTDGGSGDE